jgi:hypothetical protein
MTSLIPTLHLFVSKNLITRDITSYSSLPRLKEQTQTTSLDNYY